MEKNVVAFIESKRALAEKAGTVNIIAATLAWGAFLKAVERKSRPLTIGALKRLQAICDGGVK